MNEILAALEAAGKILQRAIFITDGAPFFMRAEEEYAKLAIDGDKATLFWPEYTSDYYGGGYLERQNVSFPASLLSVPDDELKVWKAAQIKEHQANERKRVEAERKERAEYQKANELRLLAELKAKYGA